MSHTHSTTKRRTFKHLTAYQRGQIEAMLRLGVPKVKIAKDLGIARSTLYAEIKRGTVTQKRSDWTYYEQYFAQSGQIRYERNREKSGKPSKFNAAQDFIRYVENAILKDKHSPDAICGRAKRMNLFEVSVCTKTIYNYIAKGLLKVKNIDLRQKVRRKHKEKKTHEHSRRFGESIEHRDPLIDERCTFGNWELDTIVGKKNTDAVLLAADERKQRKRHLIKIRAKTAEAVAEGIAKLRVLYGAQFSQVFRTITCDNGSEFARLQEAVPEAKVYYAHPYAPWERGTNEKQNALVRYFIPKGMDMTNLTEEDVQRVEDWINTLPRKILDYETPQERFDIALKTLHT
jgi:IS30 family transposase